MMRWLLAHGREWVKYDALEDFPFRLNYAEDGLLHRESTIGEIVYRITNEGIALIGEIHDAV